MKFGRVSVRDAEGAISAHSVRHAQGHVRKGQVLLADDVSALLAGGITEIVVAQLEPGDVHEDKAAARLAKALCGSGVRADVAFTGRVNLFSEADGVLAADPAWLTRLNRADEAITVATLPHHARVSNGRMIATVKIIPYAVSEDALQRALAVCVEAQDQLRVHAFTRHNVGLVSTRVAGTTEKVLDKTARVLGERLSALGSKLGKEIRCGHDIGEIGRSIALLRDAGHDLLIVFGASATIDRRDMVPAGIEAAGGVIDHFGMPVDPGNLLLLAHLDDIPVIGAPGCARSPRENGFDWVLQRLLAGLDVSREDITAMGAGGLLMEIESRPHPRRKKADGRSAEAPRIAALVLAAGKSSRMGGPNKLLADLFGKPLVSHTVEAATGSRADAVVVVTGHMQDQVRAVLSQEDKLVLVHNPAYADGLSTSLRAGLEALPETADGVLVCLGDMPRVGAELLNRLIDAFDPSQGRSIIVPVHQGKRGNPVLFARDYVAELLAIAGDVGARHLIGVHTDAVVEIECGAEVLQDVDTPVALREVRGGGLTDDGG